MRRTEMLQDIRKILKRVPATRQTLLFSATMPDDIRKLAVRDIENVLGERIERRTLVDFDCSVPAPAGSGGGDRARHSGQRRSAKVSGYAPVKKRGDSLHGTPRPSGRRSGARSLDGFHQLRGSSRAR